MWGASSCRREKASGLCLQVKLREGGREKEKEKEIERESGDKTKTRSPTKYALCTGKETDSPHKRRDGLVRPKIPH